jgi:hypothetical protein
MARDWKRLSPREWSYSGIGLASVRLEAPNLDRACFLASDARKLNNPETIRTLSQSR